MQYASIHVVSTEYCCLLLSMPLANPVLGKASWATQSSEASTQPRISGPKYNPKRTRTPPESCRHHRHKAVVLYYVLEFAGRTHSHYAQRYSLVCRSVEGTQTNTVWWRNLQHAWKIQFQLYRASSQQPTVPFSRMQAELVGDLKAAMVSRGMTTGPTQTSANHCPALPPSEQVQERTSTKVRLTKEKGTHPERKVSCGGKLCGSTWQTGPPVASCSRERCRLSGDYPLPLKQSPCQSKHLQVPTNACWEKQK